MRRMKGTAIARIAVALLLIFSACAIPVQGDEAAVAPGVGIAPLKLGMTVDDAAHLFGRRPDQQETRACTASYTWVAQQNDTLLASGEEAVLATPIVSQQPGNLVTMITVRGSGGPQKTSGGVGPGSPRADVTAEFGPPGGEYPDAGGKWLSYDRRGVGFLVSSPDDTVQAISVFWPAPQSTEIRPFDGVGSLSLGMEESGATEVMGRRYDVVTPLGRRAWALPVTPTYARVSCAPYVAVGIGDGKVRDIFTTASGFRTPQGVQVGDSVDALVKELGAGQHIPSAPGSLLWINTKGTTAKLIAGFRAAPDGTTQIVFFWIRAF